MTLAILQNIPIGPISKWHFCQYSAKNVTTTMFTSPATATTFPSFHFFLFLPLLIFHIGLSSSSSASSSSSSPSSSDSTHLLCSHRCHRLLRRSLNRIDQNLDVSEVLYRIGIFRRDQLLSGQVAGSSEELAPLPAGEFQDICWLGGEKGEYRGIVLRKKFF